MRLIVISDTHGNYPHALRACEQSGRLDGVIHLGDGADDVGVLERFLAIKVISVAGNCDHGSASPRELLWECSGMRLFLTHGDLYGVKSGLARLEQRAMEVGAQAALYGHTHKADIRTLSGILFLNPGTLMKSAQENSCAIIEIDDQGIRAFLQEFL